MTMNSFVIPHDLMRRQIGYVCIVICKHEAIRSFMMAELCRKPKKHIYTKQQYQIRPAIG